MTPRRPILVLTHDHRQRPALLGDLVARAGLASICLAVDGEDALPGARLLASCGALALIDAPRTEDARCAAAVQAIVARLHGDGRPLLGIGGGARTLTRALGGSIRPSPAPVRGWFRLALHPRAAQGTWLATLGATPPTTLQWHADEFLLPPGAQALLAGGPAACQGWASGRSLALNPLLHADPGLCGEWLEHWRDEPGAPGAHWRSADELAAETARHLPAQRRFASTLLGAWLDTV
jgi:GMP synthase (glutamine-hydrolysing)